MADQPAAKANHEKLMRAMKHRFWLALAALVVALGFGTLALGALSAGEGFAETMEKTEEVAAVVLKFDLLATALIVLAVACLYLVWRLRPDGD